MQQQVADWVAEVIGDEALYDQKERAARALEEALELAQACGLVFDEVYTLADYTFNRPAGDVHQELAGSVFTLFALAEAYGYDLMNELKKELARVSTPAMKARIRAKALAAPEGVLPA